MYNDVIEKMLEFNKSFVENKTYNHFLTDKFPDKKIAILACMDTRLTQLLTAALGLKNGDAKIIKNAGAQLIGPYDSVMKSLLIAVYELGATDILVIGHDDCGVRGLKGEELIELMKERGISEEAIEMAGKGCDPKQWLNGFEDIDESVSSAVRQIKEFPLFPAEIRVYGFVMDPATGAMREAKEV